MSGKRNQSPDPKDVTFMYVPPRETKGTHLAHWPPTRFERETTPIAMKHVSTETAYHAKPRGWRFTRAILSEFADDED